MSSIHELLKQVYPLKLRMELFNAIWFNWRADIKEKDKQISNIKTKLAECEKFMQENGFKTWKEAQDALNGKFECVFDEKHELWKKLVAENAQLKQQLADMTKKYELASLPVGGLVDTARNLEKQLKTQLAEIVEKIRSKCCVEDKCKDGSFVLGINEKDLDTILKEYQK